MARHSIGSPLLSSVLILVLISISLGVPSGEKAKVLKERAQRQIKQLAKTLQELDASFNDTYKWSTNATGNCEAVTKYVKEKCPSLQTTPEPPRKAKRARNLEYKTDPQSVIDSLKFYDSSILPSPIVTRISGWAVEDTLKVRLEIIHYSDIYVMKKDTIDNQKQILNKSTRKNTISGAFLALPSEATFTFNRSCDAETPTTFILIMPKNDIHHQVEVGLNVCDLRVVSSDERGIVHHYPDIPMLRMLSRHGENILIGPGEDTWIDMVLRLNSVSKYEFKIYLWDWQQNIYVHEVIDMGLNSSRLVYQLPEELLSIDTLELKHLSYPVFGRKTFTVDATIRLTVATRFRMVSGYLMLYHVYDAKSMGFKLVDGIRSEMTISLRLAHELSPLPKNSISIKTRTLNQCRYPVKTCTVICSATGSNIKTMLILKMNGYAPPIRYISSVVGGYKAYVIQEVAAPEQFKDGWYRCLVIFQDGQSYSEGFYI